MCGSSVVGSAPWAMMIWPSGAAPANDGSHADARVTARRAAANRSVRRIGITSPECESRHSAGHGREDRVERAAFEAHALERPTFPEEIPPERGRILEDLVVQPLDQRVQIIALEAVGLRQPLPDGRHGDAERAREGNALAVERVDDT